MELLDGKQTSADIKTELTGQVSEMVAKGVRAPHLAAVLVGDDGASRTYVNAKVKACELVGYGSTLVKLAQDATEEELLAEVTKLNADENIDGFIVQLPLPGHMDEQKILMAIDPKKDVDGFHPENFGRMALDLESFIPATPYGIIQLLERYKVETEGKTCVVVGA